MPLGDRAVFSGQVSVGTGSTLIRPSNISRRRLIIVVDGANPVYLAFSTDGSQPTAVAASGVRLNATGGTFDEGTTGGNGDTYKGAITAIAPAGATVVTVTEF